jgi:guanylate kinase
MIIALVGASGAGKTTLAQELLKIIPESRMVGSITTRAPRPSDIPGEYEYLPSHDVFEQRRMHDEFEWTVSIHGNHYATSRASLKRAIAPETRELMILVPDAMERLWRFVEGDTKKVFPFYIMANSTDELRHRLKKRGDKASDIQRRIDECVSWDVKVHESSIPYCLVRTTDDPADVVHLMATFIG